MRSLWVSGLGLVLGWGLAAAQAGEPQWRPVKEQKTESQPAAQSDDLGVSLGRPVALNSDGPAPSKSPTADAGVVPASYQPESAGLMRPIVRSQSPEVGAPPEPVWPKLKP